MTRRRVAEGCPGQDLGVTGPTLGRLPNLSHRSLVRLCRIPTQDLRCHPPSSVSPVRFSDNRDEAGVDAPRRHAQNMCYQARTSTPRLISSPDSSIHRLSSHGTWFLKATNAVGRMCRSLSDVSNKMSIIGSVPRLTRTNPT